MGAQPANAIRLSFKKTLDAFSLKSGIKEFKSHAPMANGFTCSRDEKCLKSNLSLIPKSDGRWKLSTIRAGYRGVFPVPPLPR